jgi:hypothetical protein
MQSNLPQDYTLHTSQQKIHKIYSINLKKSFSLTPINCLNIVESVQGFRVQGSGFRVQGSGFRVQGSGFRAQGSGFRASY